MTKFVVGKNSQDEPLVRFWLEEASNRIYLMAQASNSLRSQAVFIVAMEKYGLNIEVRKILDDNLCQLFGIDIGKSITTSDEIS